MRSEILRTAIRITATPRRGGGEFSSLGTEYEYFHEKIWQIVVVSKPRILTGIDKSTTNVTQNDKEFILGSEGVFLHMNW